MSARLDPWLALWGLVIDDGPSPKQLYKGAGDTGEVAFVRRGDDRLVLKLLPPGSDEWRSGEALRHWDGRGAVRDVELAEGAVLMERALPGDELLALVPERDEAATLIACQVMAQLNRPAPADDGFRRIEDWGAGFARNRAAATAVGMPAALIDKAEALFFELCATQGPAILLHGDFQHYNIIDGGPRGWLAIDPKGVLGEAAYETGALLRNPDWAYCADARVIERRARIMAEQLGYPHARIVGWCFSQWVLSVLWAIEDGMRYVPDWLVGPRAAETLL